MMSVNRDHAMFQNFFSTILSVFVDKNDLGAVYSEPFQIRLGARRRRRMPDVFFVAKARMDVVHEQEVEGAPDLVVEILSPESQSRDWREKFLEYELVGVREYWIVDPVSGLIEAYQWQDGKFAGIKEKDGKIASEVLRGFFVRADWFKQGQLPRIHEALRELGL
jgi:Uma2 family endonuclease